MVQVNTLYYDSTLVSQICVALIIVTKENQLFLFKRDQKPNASLGFTWV